LFKEQVLQGLKCLTIQDILFFQENGLNPMLKQAEQLRSALEQHFEKRVQSRRAKLEQYLRQYRLDRD